MRKMRKLDAVAQLQPKQGHPILAAMAPAAARVAMAMALATTAAGFTLPPSHVISPSLKLGIATINRGPQCSLAGDAGRMLCAKAKAAAPSPTLLSTASQTFAALSATLLATVQGLPALLAASALVSLIGFIRYSWFFSIGYGLSMSIMSILCMLHFSVAGVLPTIAMLHASLVLAWGVRLSMFLAHREFFAWPDAKKRNIETTNKMALTSKISTWLGVSVFDALLFSPVLFALKTPTRLPEVAWFGVSVQALGLLIEAVADQQKAAHRKKTNTFVKGGLYRLSRHPNYLGEILFWVGSFIAAIGSLTGFVQWAAASLGVIAILAVMSGATNGLDKRQMSKYAGTEGFEAYITSTPKLIPFTGGDDVALVEAAKKEELEKEKKVKATKTFTPQPSTYTKNKNPWDV